MDGTVSPVEQPSAKAGHDKRAKFVELAESRTINAIRAIRVIGKLGNKSAYEYDDADVKKLDEAAMRRLWETVGGHDPVAETDAFWQLVTAGDDAARFLRSRVKRMGANRMQFEKLLRDLDGDDFQSRQRATAALKKMGPAIAGLLRDAIDKTDSAEVKLRLQTALSAMEKSPPADPEMRRYAIAMKLPTMRKKSGGESNWLNGVSQR